MKFVSKENYFSSLTLAGISNEILVKRGTG